MRLTIRLQPPSAGGGLCVLRYLVGRTDNAHDFMDHPVVVRASVSCRHAMPINSIHQSDLVGAEIKVGPLSITIHRVNLFKKQRRIAHDVIGCTVSPRDSMPACSAGLASIIPVKHVFAHAYAQQPCHCLQNRAFAHYRVYLHNTVTAQLRCTDVSLAREEATSSSQLHQLQTAPRFHIYLETFFSFEKAEPRGHPIGPPITSDSFLKPRMFCPLPSAVNLSPFPRIPRRHAGIRSPGLP